MKKSTTLNSIIASASLLGACSAAELGDGAYTVETGDVETEVSTVQHGEALTVSPPVSQFVLLVRQGATFNERSVVQGANLGVGPGAGAVQNTLSAGADSFIGLGYDTLAQRVVLGNRSVAGNLDLTTYVPGTSVTTGPRTPYVAPVAVPNPTPATVGASNITVNPNTTQPLAPGRYNNITVNGILNLTGGLYEARSLTVNNDARVVAQGRSVVRLLTGVSALDRSRIITAAGLGAGDLTIEASGGLVSNTTLGVSLGNDAQLNAVVIASRGVRAGDRLIATGAIAAQTVTTGFNTSLSFQGGFGCTSDAECGDGAACSGQCIDAQCVLPAECSAVQIAPGSDHACATMADGTASCWGDNGPGDVGHGNYDQKVPPGPVVTDLVGTKLTNIRAVDTGYTRSCAVLNDGSVWCWGSVPTGNSNVAIQMPGFSGATTISVGGAGTCAVLTNGNVSCMDNAGTITDTGVTGATALGIGSSYACALITGGAVRCWGNNWMGTFGDGVSGPTVDAPGVLVPGLTNAVAIAASEHVACAVLSSGAVKCWGKNDYGQIGIGSVSDTIYGPTTVPGLTDAVQIGAGINHICAVRRGGTIQCWGLNFDGQLGDGDTTALYSPSAAHPVSGLSSAKQVDGATNFSCTVVRDGRAYCWGSDADATLGYGSGQLPSQSTPVRVLF